MKSRRVLLLAPPSWNQYTRREVEGAATHRTRWLSIDSFPRAWGNSVIPSYTRNFPAMVGKGPGR